MQSAAEGVESGYLQLIMAACSIFTWFSSTYSAAQTEELWTATELLL